MLIALGIVLYEQQPRWLSSQSTQPTATPTRAAISFLADAESALKAGNFTAALAGYAQVNRLEPANVDALVAQSEVQLIFRDAEKAYVYAQQAVDAAPQNPKALTAVARAFNWLNKNEEAVNAALDALEIAPQSATALAVLGEIYTDEGNYARAEEYLNGAQALEPQNITLLRNWAYLFERRRQYEQALQAYDTAIAVAPYRFDLLLEKGLLYRVGLADYKNANVAYERAVRVYKSPITLDALGEGLYNAGDHLQAVRVLRDAVELDPTYAPAQTHLGMVLYVRRNYEDAVIALEKGLAALGDKARIEHLYTLGLAYVYKEPSECDKAVIWLGKALVLAPTNSIALSGLRACDAAPDATAVN
ncbi:MAG: tetratricopeptide repeat protein [Chloroflexota bacterium]|nr:tetratricopeptide repeat protein [Chloroflexota bacterium]